MKRLKIHHIDDTRLGLSREVYAAARSEKDARATLSSAIKRVLDRDTIVVADGMNYIKGFRYQLYCEAKAVQTTNCVVHIGTPADKCRELNELALKSSSSSPSSSPTTTTTSSSTAEAGAGAAAEKKGYPPSLFENLIFRYEEPNGMNRWDSPLFTIPFEDAEGPYEAIWEALIGSSGQAKIVRQNAATVLKPAAEQGYLYELDKTTSDVIAGITGWLQDHAGEGGGEVKVVVGTAAAAEEEEKEEGVQEEGGLVVHLPVTAPSLPQLQRLRRQFITLNRQHSLSKARIRHLFVDYLNDSFQS